MNMKTTKLIASIILIESLLSACGSDGGRGNSGEPSPILEIGASNIQIGDTAEHIIAVAMDSETDDALSVIGEIDGNLGDAVVFDEPADRLDLFEKTRNIDCLSRVIPLDIAVVIPFGPSAFTDIQGDVLRDCFITRV